MKFEESIGEFKPWAFIVWTVFSLVLSLSIYRHFSFTTQSSEPDPRVTANEALKKVTDLQSKVAKLEAQVSAQPKQEDSVRKKHKSR